MDNVILNLIKLQLQLRILHWQTDSYAQHKAFGKAYEELDELIDTLVEIHQGKHGKIVYPSPSSVELVNADSISIMDVLQEVTNYLITDFPQQVDQVQDADCLNTRDEILTVLNRLKYLLTLK
tara:strand:- start:2846 stop:3214 length:369 start_codon:yes stop_codon:yes gene_type:complete